MTPVGTQRSVLWGYLRKGPPGLAASFMGWDSQDTITKPAAGSDTSDSLRLHPLSKVHIVSTVPHCALQVVDSATAVNPMLVVAYYTHGC